MQGEIPVSVGGLMNSELHLACKRADVASFDAAMAAGFDIHVTNRDGDTPLHLACSSGFSHAVDALLGAGADACLKNKYGVSALHMARSAVDAKALLSRGANPNALDKSYRNALHWAAKRGSLEVVLVLVDVGCDIDAQDASGNTPLHLAKDGLCAQALVESGAHLLIKNARGLTADADHRDKGHLEILLAIAKGFSTYGQRPASSPSMSI